MTAVARRLRITVEDIGDIAVVRFTDKKILDQSNIERIGEDLFALVDDQGRRKLLLNFSGVEYMSSAIIGKLIRLHQRMLAVDGQLVLCSIIPQLFEVFKITNLHKKMFRIVEDEQAGLDSF